MRHDLRWAIALGLAGAWSMTSACNRATPPVGGSGAGLARTCPVPVAPKDAIPRMVTAPLEELRKAIEQHDAARFTQAYDALTTGCNNCHEATDFGFNRVQRPAANPYPNQVFEPARR